VFGVRLEYVNLKRKCGEVQLSVSEDQGVKPVVAGKGRDDDLEGIENLWNLQRR
jgi:hypothetical protein